MNHVYDGFGSVQNKRRFVCKSEINRKLLEELWLDNIVTVSEVKEVFESIRDREKYVIVKTGSSKNPARQKHTKYVKKSVLRDEVFNYFAINLPDSCKRQI